MYSHEMSTVMHSQPAAALDDPKKQDVLPDGHVNKPRPADTLELTSRLHNGLTE